MRGPAARIAALHRIEAGIRGKSPEQRLQARQVDSAPLVADLRYCFEAQIARLPGRLQRFLHDGRIELDTNSVERSMRPIALSRKNRCSPAATKAPRRGHLWPR
jgi:transposase